MINIFIIFLLFKEKEEYLFFFKIYFGNSKMDKNKCPKSNSPKKSWKKIGIFVCDHKKN